MTNNYFQTQLQISEEHIFQPVGVQLISQHTAWNNGETIFDEYEFGSIKLKNIVSGEIDTFTIWGYEGDDYLYICLPTGEFEDDDEEDEILEAVALDDLGVYLNQDLTSFVSN